ncbi:tonB dependent receptor family protein [Asticcacaulis biprosthecium C19]|uniref:TonB dependent receptor family protein n=1 Tax=Asticcacaulis biprosthecium C19 TaxID=715226 RepID=F4QMP3_9CAUL|nr:tonB dependent receptor family protein [Asticcacaulis biprosthecium C19]
MTTALFPAAAYAQSAPEPADVVIQANRFAIYRGDAAFSAIDLNRDDVARSPAIDLSLKRTTQAALFRRSSSLTANPTVQGMSLRAIAPSGAGRALVTLDGVPQNDPFGGWVIWAGIPQTALNGAHVVRGAGGGAYGAGALTGVVDLGLTAPRGQSDYLRLEAGERGSHQVALGAAIGDLSLHYVTQTQNGDPAVHAPQRGAADRPTFGEDTAYLVNYRREVCPGVCGYLDLLAGHYDSRRDTGLAGGIATSSGDSLSAGFTRPATDEHNGLRLQVWHRTSDLANRSVSVGAGRASTTLANDQVATPASGTGVLAAIRHQSPDLEWEIGFDARFNDGQSEEYYRYMSGAPTRFRVAGGQTSLAGLYGEATKDYGVMSLTGAVRLDQWQSHDGHRQETDLTNGAAVLNLKSDARSYTVVSARLGATWDIAEGRILRAAAYNGFRPPSLNELYRPFRVGNDVTEANAELKPETLSGVEIGVRDRHVDVGLFYNVLKDPVTNVTIGVGPGTFPTAGFIPAGGVLRQRRNGGEITAYGVEVRGDYPVTERVALTGSATWTHARTDDGRRPAQAPAYSAAIGLDADFAPIRLTADVVFDGEAFEDDLNTLVLEPSQRLDLRADYALTDHLTLSGRVANAFDSDIQIARSGDGTVQFDTGRRFYFGLAWRR